MQYMLKIQFYNILNICINIPFNNLYNLLILENLILEKNSSH